MDKNEQSRNFINSMLQYTSQQDIDELIKNNVRHTVSEEVSKHFCFNPIKFLVKEEIKELIAKQITPEMINKINYAIKEVINSKALVKLIENNMLGYAYDDYEEDMIPKQLQKIIDEIMDEQKEYIKKTFLDNLKRGLND